MWIASSVRPNVNVFNFNIWEAWEIVHAKRNRISTIYLFIYSNKVGTPQIFLTTFAISHVFFHTIMFWQCPTRGFCWIIPYLFLFGCPFFLRSVSSCFTVSKRSCAYEACIAIHYSVNQMGAKTGQLRESEPPVQCNGSLCGLKEYKLQDRTKSKETDLLDPFSEREVALVLSSFSQEPRSLSYT